MPQQHLHPDLPEASASSTASPRLPAVSGAAATSSGRVWAVGTSTARAPAARAASTSAPMSPISTQRSALTPSRSAAARTSPGWGLRQAQPSPGAGGHEPGPSGQHSSTRRFTPDLVLGYQPAADDALIRHHGQAPWLAQPVESLARSGIARTRSGSQL